MVESVVTFDRRQFKPNPLFTKDSSHFSIVEQLVSDQSVDRVLGFFASTRRRGGAKKDVEDAGQSQFFSHYVAQTIYAPKDLLEARMSTGKRSWMARGLSPVETEQFNILLLLHELLHTLGAVHINVEDDLMNTFTSLRAIEHYTQNHLLQISKLNRDLVKLILSLGLKPGCPTLTRAFVREYFKIIQRYSDEMDLSHDNEVAELASNHLLHRAVLMAEHLETTEDLDMALRCWEGAKLMNHEAKLPIQSEDSIEAFIALEKRSVEKFTDRFEALRPIH